MKKLLLLLAFGCNIIVAQDTCETKEETLEDLNSITKCSIEPSKKGDGNISRQIFFRDV